MSGFLFRWVVAFVVLAAVYNPTQWNYTTWAQANYETDQKSLVIGLGVMLGIALLFLLVGTLRTVGLVGLLLLVVILALLSYILVGEGVLVYEMNSMNIWGGLAVLSLIVAGALSWRSSSRASRTAARQATKTAKA